MRRLVQAAFTVSILISSPMAAAPTETPPEAAATALDAPAAPAQAVKKHQRRQKRPIELGTSGGTVEDFTVDPPNVVCCGGTLGALLKKGDRYFVLSNNHVLARVNQATVGEDVVQPGLLDTNCEAPGRNLIGTIAGFKKLKLNGTNKSDSAIAETSPGEVSADGAILGIGIPGNEIVNPKVGAAVKKSGRTTGVTRGQVSATNVSGFVTFPKECGSDSEIQARFAKVFLVVSNDNQDFSAGGDSGSVIYEDIDRCPRAMGLLFAGTDAFTTVSPMKLVMKDVKKMTPKGRAELVGCDPAAKVSQRRDAAIDRAERTAMRVQRWNEDAVLALPGVVAIGIGRASSRPDQVAFKVMVEDSRREIADAIPKSIEGVPVEVVVSGRIRARQCAGEGVLEVALGGLDTTGRR